MTDSFNSPEIESDSYGNVVGDRKRSRLEPNGKHPPPSLKYGSLKIGGGLDIDTRRSEGVCHTQSSQASCRSPNANKVGTALNPIRQVMPRNTDFLPAEHQSTELNVDRDECGRSIVSRHVLAISSTAVATVHAQYDVCFLNSSWKINLHGSWSRRCWTCEMTRQLSHGI